MCYITDTGSEQTQIRSQTGHRPERNITMKMDATERTERREQIKGTRAHLRTVIEVFRATRDETPAATVAELVNRLGYETAREAVAELVNTVEEWDYRIYEYVREWAQSVETAATPDELRSHDIYQPGDIHPVHINQIGGAMMGYTPAATGRNW